MKPDAIQVAIDILRELGHEDVARWVEHPESVRELLKPAWGAPRRDDGACGDPDCHVYYEHLPHARTCRIAAAWRALGDPRGQADIERAHEEAREEQHRRSPEMAELNAELATIQRRIASDIAVLIVAK